jgi:hypothetical protein
MTQPVGFGKPKETKIKPTSTGAKQRAEASQQYDEMKDSGMPEYEVFIRTQMNKQWLAVGAIACKRSDQIHAAIYANEEALLKGAFHRMPILKKNRAKLEFEYGFRLKDYKDEPIEVAVRPPDKKPNPLQTAAMNIGTTLGGLFQKKSS